MPPRPPRFQGEGSTDARSPDTDAVVFVLMNNIDSRADLELMVVETDDDHYIGVLDTATDGRLWVRTGRRGHPIRLHQDDVIAITPAAQHPLVDLTS